MALAHAFSCALLEYSYFETNSTLQPLHLYAYEKLPLIALHAIICVLSFERGKPTERRRSYFQQE